MDRLEALRLFMRVAESASFSATAREFACSQGTVSKQIRDLETRLKTRLIARTTRRVSLTEAGELFYRSAKSISEQYDSAVGEVLELQKSPSGVIRISSPILLGRKYITPLLPAFYQGYPDLVVEHYLSDSESDLVRDGVDVSLRIGRLKDSADQARKLGSTRFVTIASPSFVEAHGHPQRPSDLRDLSCLVYLRYATPFEWHYTSKSGQQVAIRVNGPYRTDMFEAAYEAALAGLGVLTAPLSACGDDLEAGKLVRLLSDFTMAQVPIHAVMPAGALVSRKSRLLVDFLAAEFKANRWFSESAGANGTVPSPATRQTLPSSAPALS